MEPFKTLRSKVVTLLINDIDTDQIIPARYLKATDKIGMGDHLFADWRYRPDGSPNPGFVLNRPEMQGREILLAGDNFGCGSSREHAPWALVGYGFRAVISTSFADIFRNNALKNGLLPVVVSADAHQELVADLKHDPAGEVAINLAAQTITFPGGRTERFPIDSFSKHCLLEGVDQLGYLQSWLPRIKAYEAEHPAPVQTTARSR